MRLSVVKHLGLLAFAVVGIEARSYAQTIITVPPGLSPGDTYRLVFVTSMPTAATSPNISDYNTFVSNAANAVPALAALSTTWSAIASTSGVDAAANIGGVSSAPIFTLGGALVASGTADLWGGTIENPIGITLIAGSNNQVWTGTYPDGTGYPGAELGTVCCAAVGLSDYINSNWVAYSYFDPTELYPLYGISGNLVVPGSPLPPTCTAAAVAPFARAEGEAEPVGDVVLTCTGGTPPSGPSPLFNISLTLSTNLTSRTFTTTPVTSEALLLIDEPQPGVNNFSNGFLYSGQVLGTSGVAAGSSGSGNVYQGQPTSANSVTWVGVPFVAPGASTRILRLTNIRADATAVTGSPGQIYAFVSVSPSTIFSITNSQLEVASVASGLAFSATTSSITANLTFQEGFSTAFRTRIDNTTTGPFTMALQDIPGTIYCSESQFTPCFSGANCSSPPAGPLGLATTGTLLRARLEGLGTAAASLSVPNRVFANTGLLAAYLIVGGKPVTGLGRTSLSISSGTLDVRYGVAATSPYAGGGDCGNIDTFTIPAALFDSSGAPLAFPPTAVFKGNLAPVDSLTTASPTAPRPRFVLTP
jgi:hypothetical protein